MIFFTTFPLCNTLLHSSTLLLQLFEAILSLVLVGSKYFEAGTWSEGGEEGRDGQGGKRKGGEGRGGEGRGGSRKGGMDREGGERGRQVEQMRLGSKMQWHSQ